MDRIESVDIRDRRRFTDYLVDADASAVTGVAYRRPDGTETTLDADLVVDATGRTSRTPTWLANHGYESPPVDDVNVNVTYGTIRIDRPPDDRRVVFAPPSAPRTRGGAAIPVEDNRWEVIIQGVHGDDAPTTSEGFVEYVESLPVSELSHLVADQNWRSDHVENYPYPSSRRRRYEDLDRFPDGLIVTGDAVASFNPIYGQGMSVAALDALQLHHALATNGLDGLPRRFFDRVESLIDIVWQVAVGADFAFSETEGPEPAGTGLFNRYIDRLLQRAHTDPMLSEAFLRVLRLEQPPQTLLQPSIAWRVLRPFASTPPLQTVTGGQPTNQSATARIRRSLASEVER